MTATDHIPSTPADGDGPRWLTDAEQTLWRRFLLLGTRIDTALAREMQKDNSISMADYQVLVNLSEAPDHRMRIAALADRLQWDRSRLSHQITRMRNRELLTREACDEDGRGAFIVLTKTGLDVITAAAPGHVAAVRELFIDRLSPAQTGELSSILGELLTQFDLPPECTGGK